MESELDERGVTLNPRSPSVVGQPIGANSTTRDLLLEDDIDLEKSIDLAQALYRTGYVERAAKCLDSGLSRAATTDNPAESAAAVSAAKIMLACMNSLTTGQLADSVALANETFAAELSPHVDNQCRRSVAYRLLYAYRIHAIAAMTGADIYKQLPDNAATEALVLATAIARRVRDFDTALLLSHALIGSSLQQEAFQALLQIENLPEQIWARACIGLHSSTQECSPGDLARALQIVKEQHPVTYLDHKAKHVIKALEKSDWDGADELEDLLIEYERIDHQTGLIRLLVSLLEKAFAIRDMETVSRTQKDLDRITTSTGFRFLSLSLQATALARHQLATGFEDHVRQAAERLYNELTDTDLVWNQGHLAMVLCELAIRLSDFDKAQKWSSNCHKAWSHCSADSSAMATQLELRIAYLSPSTAGMDGSYLTYCDFFEQRVSQCKITVTDPNGYELQCLEYLYNAAIKLAHPSPSRKEIAMDQVVDKMHELTKDSGSHPTQSQAALLQNIARQKQAMGERRPDSILEISALEHLQKALRVYQQLADGKLSYDLINTRQLMALIQHTLFKKAAVAGNLEAGFEYLQLAHESFHQCLQGWEAMRLLNQQADCQYWIALVCYEFFLYNLDLYDNLMDKIQQAEAAFDRRRVEISVAKGLGSLRDKQSLSSDKHTRDLYRFAIQACHLRRDVVAMWDWVQKSKARSLSDLLGLAERTPASLEAKINLDAEALGMLDREKQLVQTMETATPTAYVQTQQDILTLHGEMHEHPLLATLLDMRYGTATTIREIELLVCDLDSCLRGESFIAVDWFILAGTVYILTMDSATRRIEYFPVNMALASVESWVEKYLESEQGREESLGQIDALQDHPLRLLDPLIEHIPTVAERDKLLVLCPTGILSSLPLHALHTPSHEPEWNRFRPTLIERNPIVYASSLTTFVQCCRNARRNLGSSGSSFCSFYEKQPGEELDLDERDDAYQQARELAKEHQGESATGIKVTTDWMASEWPRSSTIYFHGHCDQTSSNVLDRGLIVGEAPGVEAAAGSHRGRLINVRQLFEIPLNRPLVVLMACGSANQNISVGDEPLGLVTALLCAGAASVVGTSWAVASGPARRFSQAFLDALQEQKDAERDTALQVDVVSLARAMQLAVRVVKGSHWREPKYWAPFVLHGAHFQEIGRER